MKLILAARNKSKTAEKDMGWFTMQAEGDFNSSSDEAQIRAYDKKTGKEIGSANIRTKAMIKNDIKDEDLSPEELKLYDNAFSMAYIEIPVKFRRKGVATAIYDWAEELSSGRAIPDGLLGGSMTKEAKAFWRKRLGHEIPESPIPESTFAQVRNKEADAEQFDDAEDVPLVTEYPKSDDVAPVTDGSYPTEYNYDKMMFQASFQPTAREVVEVAKNLRNDRVREQLYAMVMGDDTWLAEVCAALKKPKLSMTEIPHRHPDMFDGEPEKMYHVSAKINGREVGWAEFGYHPGEDEYVAFSVEVDEEYRRQGIGTAMYDFFEKNKRVELHPFPGGHSKDAQKFWAKRKGG